MRNSLIRLLAASTIITLWTWCMSSWATDCLPNDITLSSQAEVDAFQTDHGPGCNQVTGKLTVTGGDNIDEVRANTDYAFITFNWQDDGFGGAECIRVGFSTQSFYLPAN